MGSSVCVPFLVRQHAVHNYHELVELEGEMGTEESVQSFYKC